MLKSLHIRLLWTFCLFSAFIGTASAQEAYLREQIDKIIRHDAEFQAELVPGFIVGIIDGDSTTVISFGEKTLHQKDTIRTDDIFEVGSLTKFMTAQIILNRAREGHLFLEDPLNLYLPEEYKNPLVAATLIEVLVHHSGLPRIPESLGAHQPNPEDPYAAFGTSDLLDWYAEVRPRDNGLFRYSHTGYAMLEVVIGITGHAYGDAFEKLFRQTLGLLQTTLTPDPGLAPGYDFALRRVEPWTFPAFAASEGARSSMNDLLQLVSGVLNEHEALVPISGVIVPTETKKIYSGPGMYCLFPKKKFPVWMHTGHTSGHYAFMAYTHVTKTGVVILANSAAGTGDLGLLILRMINGQWKRKN